MGSASRVTERSGPETRTGSAHPRVGAQRPRSPRGLNLGCPGPPRVPTSAPPHAPAPFTGRRTPRSLVPTHHGSVALSSRDEVLICNPGCCQGKRCGPSHTHHCHLSRGRLHSSHAPHLALRPAGGGGDARRAPAPPAVLASGVGAGAMGECAGTWALGSAGMRGVLGAGGVPAQQGRRMRGAPGMGGSAQGVMGRRRSPEPR